MILSVFALVILGSSFSSNAPVPDETMSVYGMVCLECNYEWGTLCQEEAPWECPECSGTDLYNLGSYGCGEGTPAYISWECPNGDWGCCSPYVGLVWYYSCPVCQELVNHTPVAECPLCGE